MTSILLLDASGKHLRHGAAPSLPSAYNEAIDGIEIGPAVGSCGTAAFVGHAIYVTDIERDPLWADFRALAIQHGLRACWSTPFFAPDSTVLGTLAVYYREPRAPTEWEKEVVRHLANSVAVLVGNARLASRIKDLSEGAQLAAEAGGLGFFIWDVETDTVRWENDRPYEILGIPRSESPVNASRFASEFLHPDEQDSFSGAVAVALASEAKFHFLGRIRRKDTGELRHVEITGRVETTNRGRRRVVGIIADVTARLATPGDSED
jgi:PAS domain-containing protein